MIRVLFVFAALGYLIGSIPFGWLLTRAAGLGDIRGVGSGNIGATNVLRTGRRDIAAATLLLDAGKGAAAVLLNTAVAKADDPVRMALSMRHAVEAGRLAHLAGRIPRRGRAEPSSPQFGLVGS